MSEDDYRPDQIAQRRDDLVVITGCSGGGKSSLLAELARRGFATFPEAGRQIVREQLFIGGFALPWIDLAAFVDLSVSRALHQAVTAAGLGRTCFLDRGVVDQVSALERRGLAVPPHLANAVARCRYRRRVLVLPPWRDIYRTDDERRHGFDEAVADYEALVRSYVAHGYELVTVPTGTVEARADFVNEEIERS